MQGIEQIVNDNNKAVALSNAPQTLGNVNVIKQLQEVADLGKNARKTQVKTESDSK